ncbi:MAG: hypothetical protein JKY02_06640 [Flavobacteriaceae bacterium]|nr:hypothetical protein [Flavobacteriaceae bacterium]
MNANFYYIHKARESWEHKAILSLKQRVVSYTKNDKKYLRYKLLLKIIHKIPELENKLNVEEINIFKKKVDLFIYELPTHIEREQSLPHRVFLILDDMNKSFLLIDKNHYLRLCLFISITVILFVSLIFELYFLGALFGVSNILIGVSLDIFNQRKGITI